MRLRTLACLLVAGLGPIAASGCVSLALHLTPAQSEMPPDFPNGAVIYPTLHALGGPSEDKGVGPLDYLFIAVDFPFSLVMDTLFVPYDLTHPISSFAKMRLAATRPNSTASEDGSPAWHGR